jgi:hypothetical protein
MKQRRFFFHFNKPASLQQKKTLWSVHWKGQCHVVEHVFCKTSCESKSNKKQPYAVMQGFASKIDFFDNMAIIFE